eukprot:Plantae.Rhodophyta-Hildenbrandia_rubra.ctg4067.p1 GENE.Plantae.Rhodophyta-Hildenbrandia_rubra.ctg4067~~Plantae.Rhodophyta-Hildenbrandia_rubra.ctg4067.p1  ORF type:complete len:471 (-),score=61.77 Plantae.Rhodophyta-Hildenbrandia_rubra.ctg4067:3041-4279(-)
MDGTTSLLEVHKCLASERIRARNERDGLRSDAMEIDGKEPGTANAIAFPQKDIMILQGHTSEVFVCAWNPRSSVLATGSGDSTVRLWPIPHNAGGVSTPASAAVSQPIVLVHEVEDNVRDRANDVTTVSWNNTGSELASGSYDGKVRVWKENGDLKHTLKLHKGPLFSVEWNDDSSYLLSCSVDNTTAVWDPVSGQIVKHFRYHTKPTLDIDWRDRKSFASCSSDKTICLCSVDEDTPQQVFHGHQDEINCVKWDPSGTLLASCSDDFSAKIWSPNSSSCVFDLREHTKPVYTLRWSPNANRRLLLATASFDALIKLWDINTGRCIKTLASHTSPVYSIDFSPNGEYLVSGSFDHSLNVWNVKDGTLVKTYKGNEGIFEVGWNKAGDKIAACYANNCVSVLDMRHSGIVANS